MIHPSSMDKLQSISIPKLFPNVKVIVNIECASAFVMQIPVLITLISTESVGNVEHQTGFRSRVLGGWVGVWGH